MIVITNNYSIIDKEEMTDNFIINPEFVKRVWDINEGVIGISFLSLYEKGSWKIILEGDDKKLLAKDLLKMILDKMDITINGDIKQN